MNGGDCSLCTDKGAGDVDGRGSTRMCGCDEWWCCMVMIAFTDNDVNDDRR